MALIRKTELKRRRQRRQKLRKLKKMYGESKSVTEREKILAKARKITSFYKKIEELFHK